MPDIYLSSRGSKNCRGCGELLGEVILSLGNQPLPNELPLSFTNGEIDLFPLDFKICDSCGLGQIGEFASPDRIFQDYSYFSSVSSSWVEHARIFAHMMFEQVPLSKNDLVLEIASNDGYLLKHFINLGCKVLGVEPAQNVARVAIASGVPTEVSFFGEEKANKLIAEGIRPKLVVCNNVLAHVPDINDFLKGLKQLASVGALITVEAPSMKKMMENNLFDTIYHEHFSYLSAYSINKLAKQNGLKLFKVESLSTHGGSNRYWLCDEMEDHQSERIAILEEEEKFGILERPVQRKFANESQRAIDNFSDWCSTQEFPIIGYGAAAKATVLLNAAGQTYDNFSGIADNAPSKQNRYVPGTGIRIDSVSETFKNTKGNVVIFPWNIADEISNQILNEIPEFSREIWIPLPKLRRIK